MAGLRDAGVNVNFGPGVDVLDRADAAGSTQFGRGLRSSTFGTEASYLSAQESEARSAGDFATAERLREEGTGLRRRASTFAPRVQSTADVNGVGDALDFASGAVGSAIGSTQDPLLGGALGGAAGGALSLIPALRPASAALRGLGAYSGAFAPSYRQAKGEFFETQMADPVASQATPQEIDRRASMYGAGSGLLESVVPAALGARGLGRLAAGKLPTKGLGGMLPAAGLEGATEVAQGELSRQGLGYINPGRDTSGDMQARIDEGVQGALGGAAFHAPSSVMTAATKLPGELARGTKAAAGDMLDLQNPDSFANRTGDAVKATIDSAKATIDGTIDLKDPNSPASKTRDFFKDKAPGAKKAAEGVVGSIREAADEARNSVGATVDMAVGEADLLDGSYKTKVPKEIIAAGQTADWMRGKDAEAKTKVEERLRGMTESSIAGDDLRAAARDALASGDIEQQRAVAARAGKVARAQRVAAELAAATRAAVFGRKLNEQDGPLLPRAELAAGSLSTRLDEQLRQDDPTSVATARKLGAHIVNLIDSDPRAKGTADKIREAADHFVMLFGKDAPGVLEDEFGDLIAPIDANATQVGLRDRFVQEVNTLVGDRTALVKNRDQRAKEVRKRLLVEPETVLGLREMGLDLGDREQLNETVRLFESMARTGDAEQIKRVEAAFGKKAVGRVISYIEAQDKLADRGTAGTFDDNEGVGSDQAFERDDISDAPPNVRAKGNKSFDEKQADALLEKGSGKATYVFPRGGDRTEGVDKVFGPSGKRKTPELFDTQDTVAEYKDKVATGKRINQVEEAVRRTQERLGERYAVEAVPAKEALKDSGVGMTTQIDAALDNLPEEGSSADRKLLENTRLAEAVMFYKANPASRKIKEDQRRREGDPNPTFKLPDFVSQWIKDNYVAAQEAGDKKEQAFWRALGSDLLKPAGEPTGRGNRAMDVLRERAQSRIDEILADKRVVRARLATNADPLRIEQADIAALSKSGAASLESTRNLEGRPGEARTQGEIDTGLNMLRFTDAAGKPVNVVAGDLVRWVREREGKAFERDAKDEKVNVDKDYIKDLMTGVSAMVDALDSKTLPKKLVERATARYDDFADGVPRSLVLPSGKSAYQYAEGQKYAQKMRALKEAAKSPEQLQEEADAAETKKNAELAGGPNPEDATPDYIDRQLEDQLFGGADEITSQRSSRLSTDLAGDIGGTPQTDDFGRQTGGRTPVVGANTRVQQRVRTTFAEKRALPKSDRDAAEFEGQQALTRATTDQTSPIQRINGANVIQASKRIADKLQNDLAGDDPLPAFETLKMYMRSAQRSEKSDGPNAAVGNRFHIGPVLSFVSQKRTAKLQKETTLPAELLADMADMRRNAARELLNLPADQRRRMAPLLFDMQMPKDVDAKLASIAGIETAKAAPEVAAKELPKSQTESAGPAERVLNEQNDQAPGTRVLTQAEMDEAKAYVAKVLGPRIKVQFKATTGYSGEWIDAADTIVISTTAAPGAMQTAYHEAMHAFWSQFVNSDPDLKKLLENAVANNPEVARQLRRLLAGHPAAIAAVNRSAEERVAYTYQFYAAGLLTVSPAAKTVFQKVKRFFKRVLRLTTDAERADGIFEAFHAGRFDGRQGGAGQIIAEKLNYGTWPKAARLKIDKQLQKMAGLALPAHDIIKNLDSATAKQLAQMLFVQPGQSGDAQNEGFINARERRTRQYLNRFAAEIEVLNEAERADLLKALQAPTSAVAFKPVADARGRVRNLLARIYDDVSQAEDEAGVLKADKLPRVENYFPRIWDSQKLWAKQAEFVTHFSTKYKDDVLRTVAGIAKQRRTIAKAIAGTGKTPAEVAANNQRASTLAAEAARLEALDASGAALELWKALVENTGVEDKMPASREDGVLTPWFEGSNARKLTWIKDDDAEISTWLDDDLVSTMTRYFRQASRSMEYTRRFGQRGEKLNAMMNLVQEELDKNAPAEIKDKDGWVDQRMNNLRRSVGAIEGTLGKDVTPFVRSANSYMIVYQNLRLLPLALFSSVVDPLGILARGGELQDAYQTFLRGMSGVMEGWKQMAGKDKARATDEATKLAEMVGTIDSQHFLDTLGDAYASEYLDDRARKINNKMFAINGMEAWNRSMKIGATTAARSFIERHSLTRTAEGDRWLTELGLTPGTLIVKDGKLVVDAREMATVQGLDWNTEQGKERARAAVAPVHVALSRWVDGAVLSPNAAQRPAWASDPNYAVFFHLKQFTYSFHQTILRRAVKEAQLGNFGPIGAFVWYVPVMIAADITKGLLTGMGELPNYMKAYNLGDWVMHGVQRAGLMGVGQIGTDVEADLFSIFGPAVEQVTDAIADPADKTLLRALPANAVYREAFQ